MYNYNPAMEIDLPAHEVRPETLDRSAIRDEFELARAYYENPAVLQALLNAGADIEAKEGRYDLTPLHLAANQNYNPAVIQALLDAGADPEAKEAGGRTPLHFAMGLGNPVVIQALLEAGAYPDARDNRGQTPLHWVAKYYHGSPEAIRILLDNGADVNAMDYQDQRPLEVAISHHSQPIIQVLRDNGARE